MPQRPDQSSIANAAAARLGSTKRMGSIHDGSELSRHVVDQWNGIITTMLADHPWNFLIRRATLNALTDAPGSEYAFQYALPADCWRWLPWLPDDPDYFCGEAEGGNILTDAEAPIAIRYISGEYADQVGRWPAHFATAVELELAHRLAEPMTGSTSLARDMRDLAAEALMKAKKVDGLESNGRGGPNINSRSRWGKRRFLRHGVIPGMG